MHSSHSSRAGAERSSAFQLPMLCTALLTPVCRRHFAPGHLQFITSSTYRRTKLFDSHRLHCDFVEVLGQFRQEAGFLLIAPSQSFTLRQRADLFGRGIFQNPDSKTGNTLEWRRDVRPKVLLLPRGGRPVLVPPQTVPSARVRWTLLCPMASLQSDCCEEARNPIR